MMKRQYRLWWVASSVMVLGLSLAACAPFGVSPSASSVVSNPNSLKGASSDDIRSLLGEPDRKRHDHPAVVWQYTAGKNCVLDVFMYEERQDRFITEYAQVRSSSGKTPSSSPDKQCMQTLISRR